MMDCFMIHMVVDITLCTENVVAMVTSLNENQ